MTNVFHNPAAQCTKYGQLVIVHFSRVVSCVEAVEKNDCIYVTAIPGINKGIRLNVVSIYHQSKLRHSCTVIQ